jgi:hypothetical protein
MYICARPQLTSSAKGEVISGLKIAEYWPQVNPLMIHRSATFDVSPFDRPVADARRRMRAALYQCPHIGASLRAML